MTEVVVTRNGQITLTKDIREKLGIREGDEVIINLIENSVLISKKDESVWEKTGSFLPQNFMRILKEIRGETLKRFKKLGITE